MIKQLNKNNKLVISKQAEGYLKLARKLFWEFDFERNGYLEDFKEI